MKFNVTEIEFDFDDDYANGFDLTFDEEIELRDLTLGVFQGSYGGDIKFQHGMDLIKKYLLQ